MNAIAPIQSLILEIRGQRVMLDRDLAMLYGVETRVLNQAVKRNAARFDGDDFMFRLTKDEANNASLKSQFVISKEIDIQNDSDCLHSLKSQSVISNSTNEITSDEYIKSEKPQIETLNRRGGDRYLPYAFTSLGVAMLSSVLKSETAIAINREIMRTFVYLSQLAKAPMPSSNEELRRDIENLRQEMNDILADQNDINEETRAQLDAISQTLADMQAKQKTSNQSPRRKIGFV